MDGITGFSDEHLTALIKELTRRAVEDMERKRPAYIRWLREKLQGPRTAEYLGNVLDAMRTRPLPEGTEGGVMWRAIVMQALEVRTSLDDLAVSLHYLQNPPACDGCDVLVQHEFEHAVLKYESLRDHYRDLGQIVLRRLTKKTSAERNAIVAPLGRHSVKSLRDTFGHTLVAPDGDAWLMFALTPREAGEAPRVGLSVDFGSRVPGLVSFSDELAAEGESLAERLRAIIQ